MTSPFEDVVRSRRTDAPRIDTSWVSAQLERRAVRAVAHRVDAHSRLLRERHGAGEIAAGVRFRGAAERAPAAAEDLEPVRALPASRPDLPPQSRTGALPG